MGGPAAHGQKNKVGPLFMVLTGCRVWLTFTGARLAESDLEQDCSRRLISLDEELAEARARDIKISRVRDCKLQAVFWGQSLNTRVF